MKAFIKKTIEKVVKACERIFEIKTNNHVNIIQVQLKHSTIPFILTGNTLQVSLITDAFAFDSG